MKINIGVSSVLILLNLNHSKFIFQPFIGWKLQNGLVPWRVWTSLKHLSKFRQVESSTVLEINWKLIFVMLLPLQNAKRWFIVIVCLSRWCWLSCLTKQYIQYPIFHTFCFMVTGHKKWSRGFQLKILLMQTQIHKALIFIIPSKTITEVMNVCNSWVVLLQKLYYIFFSPHIPYSCYI